MTMWKKSDGTFSSDRSAAVLAGGASSSGDAAAAVAAAWLRSGETVVPVQVAVGTSLHEGNYAVNIRNIESNGHTTGGVFELDLPTISPYFSKGDAVAALMPLKDPFDLDDACSIFASLCRYRLARIIRAANAWETKKQSGMVWPDEPPAGSQVWAYVGMAHNLGLGSALTSIQSYGLDWSGYKTRNPTINFAIDRGSGIYGDDVITGGVDWKDSFSSPFDSSGAAIDVSTVDAYTSSKIRLALLITLLGLVVYFFAINRTPLKGTL